MPLKRKRIILCSLLALALLTCGCRAADNSAQAPDDGGMRGIVTAVSADSITVALIGDDGFGDQGGTASDRQPGSSGRPDDGAQRPEGTPPTDGFDRFNTADMEQRTYRIDADTEILQMKSDGTTGPGTLDDLAQNMTVSIVPEDSDDGKAARITVMAAFGAERGARQDIPEAPTEKNEGDRT